MSTRNTKTTLAGIKLGIFVLVSLIVTGTLTAIMGSFAFGSETVLQGRLQLGQPDPEG